MFAQICQRGALHVDLCLLARLAPDIAHYHGISYSGVNRPLARHITPLECLDDFKNGDTTCRTRQTVPTLTPSQTLNQASTAKHQQNLTDKVLINVLASMNVTCLYRCIATMHRNINHCP